MDVENMKSALNRRNRLYRGPDLTQHPLSEEECLQLAQLLQTTQNEKLTEVIIAYLKSKGKNNFGERNYWPDIRAYLMTNDFYGITSNKSRELTIDEIRQRTHTVLTTTIQKLKKTLNTERRYWKRHPSWDEMNEESSVDNFCNSSHIDSIRTLNQALEREETIPALVWNVSFSANYPSVTVILGKDSFGSRIFARIHVNHSKHLSEILPHNNSARGMIIPFQVYNVSKKRRKGNHYWSIIGSSPGTTKFG